MIWLNSQTAQKNRDDMTIGRNFLAARLILIKVGMRRVVKVAAPHEAVVEGQRRGV